MDKCTAEAQGSQRLWEGSGRVLQRHPGPNARLFRHTLAELLVVRHLETVATRKNFTPYGAFFIVEIE